MAPPPPSLSPCTAAVDEEVPTEAVLTMSAAISLNMAMKMNMSPSPNTAGVEEEVPKEAVHNTKAANSLNMAMTMKAVDLRQRCRQASDMSWAGTTCLP